MKNKLKKVGYVIFVVDDAIYKLSDIFAVLFKATQPSLKCLPEI